MLQSPWETAWSCNGDAVRRQAVIVHHGLTDILSKFNRVCSLMSPWRLCTDHKDMFLVHDTSKSRTIVLDKVAISLLFLATMVNMLFGKVDIEKEKHTMLRTQRSVPELY